MYHALGRQIISMHITYHVSCIGAALSCADEAELGLGISSPSARWDGLALTIAVVVPAVLLCPCWQLHRTGCSRWPVRTLPSPTPRPAPLGNGIRLNQRISELSLNNTQNNSCVIRCISMYTFYSPSRPRGRPSCLCPHHNGAEKRAWRPRQRRRRRVPTPPAWPPCSRKRRLRNEKAITAAAPAAGA